MPTFEGDDGVELHYDLRGMRVASVSPLIVLAGGAARHPDYLGDLAGLGDQYQLALPHLRGVGHSRRASTETIGSWWSQALDIERLRAELHLARCTLVAHSAGTRLAIAFAAQFPDRLGALVLITPPASYLVDTPSDASDVAKARVSNPEFEAALAAQAAGPDISSDETFNAWQKAVAPIGYAEWNDLAKAHARSSAYFVRAAQAFLSAEPPDDLPERLGKVDAPTLVIAGAQDAIVGVAPVIAVADLFPNGCACVIDSCGHYPWVEQPARFRELLDSFLVEQR